MGKKFFSVDEDQFKKCMADAYGSVHDCYVNHILDGSRVS